MSNDTDTIESPEARVARGVAFLDAIDPNWRKLIDIKKFDFISIDRCVWGQLKPRKPFGAVHAAWLNHPETSTYPTSLGFDGVSNGEPGSIHADREALSALWLAEITPPAPERFTHIFQPYFMVETDLDGSNPKLSVDWDACYGITVDGNSDPVDEYDGAFDPAIAVASNFMDLFVMAPVNNLLDSLTATK